MWGHPSIICIETLYGQPTWLLWMEMAQANLSGSCCRLRWVPPPDLNTQRSSFNTSVTPHRKRTRGSPVGIEEEGGKKESMNQLFLKWAVLHCNLTNVFKMFFSLTKKSVNTLFNLEWPNQRAKQNFSSAPVFLHLRFYPTSCSILVLEASVSLRPLNFFNRGVEDFETEIIFLHTNSQWS